MSTPSEPNAWHRAWAWIIAPLPASPASPACGGDTGQLPLARSEATGAPAGRHSQPGAKRRERPQGATPERFRVPIVLVTSALVLIALWQFGRLPFYRAHVAPIFFAGASPATIDLYGYYYLAASSVVTRMLVPLVVILAVFRQRPGDYGYRVRGTAGLAKIYLGLLAIMLPVLFYASSQPAFQAKYPLYDYAHESLGVFLVYELSYVLVFLSGESFWRGFMVWGLAPRLGLYGLIVMAIPYAMVHFGKPFPEALGAILTGLVLGYLAIKHRSFWLGVALHSSIGIAMDVLCLWRKGQLGPLFGL